MENDDGEKDTESEETELRLKVESLKQDLHDCRAELMKLQKLLNQSERLQRNTESYNEDLRKQASAAPRPPRPQYRWSSFKLVHRCYSPHLLFKLDNKSL